MDKDTPVVGFTDDAATVNEAAPEIIFNSVMAVVCILAWVFVAIEVLKPFAGK